MSGVVNGHDCLGIRGDQCLGVTDVDVSGISLNVSEFDCGAERGRGLGGYER